MTFGIFVLSAILATAGKDGVELTVESETTKVDPAKSLFLTVRLVASRGREVALPDLRERVVGFSLAEDFTGEPVRKQDGSTVKSAEWRLIPEPCADVYKIRPLAVENFIVPAITFEPPPAREPVTGGMECQPTKDFPPLSWQLVGLVALILIVGALAVCAIVLLFRQLFRKVKEHRMSPIERAWVELDRLIRKELPRRGRYKDFYVELTMVVRRYIQRKYGIKAPHLTTEEFFDELARSDNHTLEPSNDLRLFLELADLVKFAGVEATPDMADEATTSARNYLKSDSQAKLSPLTNHQSS